MKCPKYLRLTGICAVLLSPTLVQAQVVNGIDIVSQSYSVDIQWSERWILEVSPPVPPSYEPYPPGDWSAGYEPSPSGDITGGYNMSTSDGSPITASSWPPAPTAEGQTMWSEASIDRFSFHHHTRCAFTGVAYTTPLGYAFRNPAGIQTSTQGIWDFRPTAGSLNIHIEGLFATEYGPPWATLSIELRDVTSSSSLLSIAGAGPTPTDDPFEAPGGANYLFVVDPGHLYEFTVSGSSATSDNDFMDADILASFTSVPEPSTLGLAGLGALALMVARRRK